MKTKIYFMLLLATAITVSTAQNYAVANVKITTSSVPAADVNQGTINLVVYAAKMEGTNASVTVNNITFTLSGSHDNNDLTSASIYFNSTTPDLVGAAFLNSVTATFAAPHTYSVTINRTLAAGETGYFVIVVSISNTATDNKTVRINGATDPVTFGFTTAPNVDNQQTDKAKNQTIQAADITLTSNSVLASDVNQGTINVLTNVV